MFYLILLWWLFCYVSCNKMIIFVDDNAQWRNSLVEWPGMIPITSCARLTSYWDISDQQVVGEWVWSRYRGLISGTHWCVVTTGVSMMTMTMVWEGVDTEIPFTCLHITLIDETDAGNYLHVQLDFAVPALADIIMFNFKIGLGMLVSCWYLAYIHLLLMMMIMMVEAGSCCIHSLHCSRLPATSLINVRFVQWPKYSIFQTLERWLLAYLWLPACSTPSKLLRI